MPYIKQADRPQFDVLVDQLVDLIKVDGELNYCVTTIVHKIAMRRGINYQNLNNLDGALGQIQAEFRRMIIARYEDLKIVDNGYASKLDRMLAEGKVPDPKTY